MHCSCNNPHQPCGCLVLYLWTSIEILSAELSDFINPAKKFKSPCDFACQQKQKEQKQKKEHKQQTHSAYTIRNSEIKFTLQCFPVKSPRSYSWEHRQHCTFAWLLLLYPPFPTTNVTESGVWLLAVQNPIKRQGWRKGKFALF